MKSQKRFVFMAARDGPQAAGLTEQLAKATGRKDPAVLDALAAAYAEAGQWDEAVATARQAVGLATAAGQHEAAGQIEERLRLHEQQKPFRAGPAD
jgi:Flp pilus assembly protein TadD